MNIETTPIEAEDDNVTSLRADRQAIQALALALWQVQHADAHPREGGARRAAWREARPEMIRTARKVLRRMARVGVTVSAPEVTATPEAVEATAA
ncbi:MAG: hypothetical protein JJU40_07585 [Rhodobacteraceae bacterium]|nr:hypothetical protein [Paracoccaceae bacterium]